MNNPSIQDMKTAFSLALFALSGASAMAAVTLPYTPTFYNSSSLDGWTIIDSNADNSTWSYYASDGSLIDGYSNDGAEDDWAITPAITLQAGYSYMLSFDAYCRNPLNAERLEVYYGTAATVDGMATAAMAATEIAASSDDPFGYSAYITPAADGDYYIGFHAISDAGRYYLHLLNICLATGVSHSVPGEAQNLAINFTEPSLTGTVTFDTPSTTFGGTASQGELTYTLLINGETYATGSSSYSSTVSIPVEIASSSECTFGVYLTNSAGDCPTVEQTVYIGYDSPEATASVEAAWSDGFFTVVWNKVTESAHGGYMDTDSLTYTLTRYPDETIVATGLTDTTYTDAVAAAEAVYYHYTVAAVAEGMSSQATESNEVGVGYFTPPFEPTFSSEEETIVGMFTIYDANSDGRTWQYKSKNSFYSRNNTANAADDWLITPGLNLENGKTYKLTYRAWGQNSTKVVTYEVKYGTAPTIASMTEALVDTTDRSGNITTEEFEAYITPDSSGVYYVGFHNISAKSTTDLYVGYIVVAAGVTLEVPDSVTSLIVTPDNTTRDPHCTISFVAPTQGYLGGTLESLTKIEVFRGDDVVHTVESPSPGDTISLEDTASATGTYTYTVIPYNSYGAGREASQNIYLGINVTTAVTALHVSEPDQDGKVTFTWEAPTTDIAGYPTNPEFITYTIEKVGEQSNTTIVSKTSDTTYTYQAISSTATQQFMQWTIYAITDGGTSESFTTDNLPTGTPYPMPFKESFPNGETTQEMMVQAHAGGSSTWYTYTDDDLGLSAYDGDNGFAAMRGAYKYYCAGLYSGKVAITGDNPALSFYAYRISEDSRDVFEIYARTGDDDWTLLDSLAMEDFGSNLGWKRLTYFLNDYAGQSLQFRFDATTYTKVYHPIDLIEVKEMPADNLAIDGIVCPTGVEPNEEFSLDVTVRNIGRNKAQDYTVALYRDGELYATATGEELAVGERAVIAFDETITVVAADSIEYYATVTYAADGDTSDNTSDTYTIAFNQYDYPTVSDLTGQITSDGAVLSWSTPDISGVVPDRVTDDFESYDSWASQAGNWTFEDLDKSGVLALYNITYPDAKYDGIPKWNTLSSFWIMDWSYDGMSNFKGNSGSKCLISLGRYDDGQVDDWAISEELYGGEQEITFWARSYNNYYPEKVSVLYSTTDTSLENFTTVETFDSLSTVGTTFSATIPDGSKYFALRSCAINGQALLIDDVSYIPNAVSGIAIEGYNVYRDGSRINGETVTETTYTDASFSGSAQYVVSVVYNYGESQPSNAVYVDESGVIAIANASDVSIRGTGGCIVITGAAGLPVAVGSVDGRLLYCGTGSAVTIVPAQPGIYVARAGSATAKVVVR